MLLSILGGVVSCLSWSFCRLSRTLADTASSIRSSSTKTGCQSDKLFFVLSIFKPVCLQIDRTIFQQRIQHFWTVRTQYG
ncbi:hypothetical protein CC77DRAFT_1025011 [Alternaria alternata]|uniref:Secreted protein n=1 Tax=Alternaria alternata TaxID=5599 RepID=A0A177D7I0_ALTAL|nr:hypothetical protein CC77DRAFT_1025011 [Alternaria alternata]OAG15247.1 hypothetical protein CC77DRAFT_1025011 [Alternaria alternata]